MEASTWNLIKEHSWFPWTTAILGSLIVGLSGVVPLLFIPKHKPKPNSNAKRNLQRQLSFAFGGLLGDVFLHLVPEAYESESDHIRSGLWIIVGVVAFIFIGKLFQQSTNHDSKKIMGYLNLLANSIDNFIHGLAVASSFLTSFKLGFTTVFAILVHEIPHEIGDFAILLNSGFTRYEAAKAQLATAATGMTGACVAIWINAVDADQANSLWILPFSAGGFLNIALVSVLPEILDESTDDPKELIIQFIFVLLGILVMSLLCLI